MTHMLKVIGESYVRSVLTWPLVNQAVEEAMKATAQDGPNAANQETAYVSQPPRTLVQAGNRSQILLTMPCYVGNYQLPVLNADATTTIATKRNTLACKLVTSFSSNSRRTPALPNIMANILLISEQTGQLLCVMDGTQITAWRTAAASIVATKYLYFHRAAPTFEKRQIKLAIIGCGVQGRSHAFGMCHTFDVTEVFLWNRTVSKADKLAEDLRNAFDGKAKAINIQVSSTAAEAVADADVVCVGTYADKALVEYDMLKKGDVHINTVGAGQVHFGEVSNDIYTKAHVYVDSMASAEIELEGLPAVIVDEVGSIILKKSYPQRGSITIFQSMGMASEDATVAQAVFEALESGKKV